jgi:Trk K+ transport system NAD-binding subunit
LNESEEQSPKAVLVCGLGRLGQHCAVLLKELGIPVYGLHDVEERLWETEAMSQVLDRYTVGDLRRHSVLQQAGIASCRAALFTTSDERANISGALAARSLNPAIRLVIRSSQTNLNERLNQRLGNLVALDIADLPATAFSLAAIGHETIGLLSVEGLFLRVVEKRIAATDHWALGRELHSLNTRWRRVLHHNRPADRAPVGFDNWDPTERVRAGDLLAYIEFYEPEGAGKSAQGGKELGRTPVLTWSSIRARVRQLWSGASQTRRIAAVTAACLLLIHATGVALYKLHYPEVSLLDAFNVATVLIFDGYSNMFAQLKLPFPISLWMLLYSLMMTMAGAVVMGMVYAFLTARVLSARLEFRRRPGRIPRAKHVVVIGLGPLGRRVAELLADLNQPVVGVSATELDPGVLPRTPVIVGDPRESLVKANCATAASIMALTDDDVANLELALTSAQSNEECRLVVRSDDAEFGGNVTALAPHTFALSIYTLSAEAFAATALGENVLNLFRIGHQTVLTTEFMVEAGDTLEGRLLAEATSGYGLAAILYQRTPSEKAEFFPSEDIRLETGSRLVVLATMGGLQNAEHGVSSVPTRQLRLLKAPSEEARFEAARIISRITRCNLGAAKALFSELPANVPQVLYEHQALRLAGELRSIGVDAEVLTANGCGGENTPSGD